MWTTTALAFCSLRLVFILDQPHTIQHTTRHTPHQLHRAAETQVKKGGNEMMIETSNKEAMKKRSSILSLLLFFFRCCLLPATAMGECEWAAGVFYEYMLLAADVGVGVCLSMHTDFSFTLPLLSSSLPARLAS